MKIPPFNRHEVTWATSDLYSSAQGSLPSRKATLSRPMLCPVIYRWSRKQYVIGLSVRLCVRACSGGSHLRPVCRRLLWLFSKLLTFFAYNYSYTVFKCMSVIYVHVCMVDKLNPGENLALGSPSKMLSYMNTSNEQWLRVGLYTVCSSSVASSLDKCPVSLRRLGAVNSRVYTRLLSGQSLSPYRSVVLLVS